MRANDNKWGGMKMAFGKWEKNENMTMQLSQIKRSYYDMLQRNDNAWSKSQMTLDDIK